MAPKRVVKKNKWFLVQKRGIKILCIRRSTSSQNVLAGLEKSLLIVSMPRAKHG